MVFFRRYVSRLVVCAATAFLCATAFAQNLMPESGLYFNRSENGIGYSIEVQDNQLFFTQYGYDAGRTAVWYYSGGRMVTPTTYAGPLFRTSGGPCAGCNYTPPVSTQIDTINITFTSPSSVTLRHGSNARTVELTRFAFGIAETSPHKMLGEWAVVQSSSTTGVYLGDRLSAATTFRGTDGRLYASGYVTGLTGRTLLAIQETDGSWSLLLDTSLNYWTYMNYRFAGLNAIEGRAWTFEKGRSLSGAGLPFIAYRSASAAFASTGIGPAMPKQSAVERDELIGLRRSQTKAQAPGTEPAPPAELVQSAGRLQSQLPLVVSAH